MKDKTRKNVLSTVGVYLVLLALALSGTTLSKFAGEGKTDALGRAAKFNISVNEANLPENGKSFLFFEGKRIDNGSNGELAFNNSELNDVDGYYFTVTNNSEVRVECSFKAINISNPNSPEVVSNVVFSSQSVTLSPGVTSSNINITIKPLKEGDNPLADSFQKIQIETVAVQID